MIVVPARPPNFDAILEKMPDADKAGVIFAYGERIFNPSGIEIPPALIAHEAVHCKRQHPYDVVGPETWWVLYLNDPEFRYHEELLAHVAEYGVLAQRMADRNDRARLLHSTARRLIAPLYNYEPPRSLSQATRDLTQEINR